MYIKLRKNSSGSTSVQVVEKVRGKSHLIKTIGSSSNQKQISELKLAAKDFIEQSDNQLKLGLISSETDSILESYLSSGNNPIVKAKGPELILGKIFDRIGLNRIKEALFRHLVLARLTYPVSKLKTTEYMFVHQQQDVEVSSIYRFLDRFHKKYKQEVEQIVFEHTKKRVKQLTVVFYDMTTLYFEAENEDDLRKIGFSKDGKFQHPQILLGLLVGENGYPIAYDIYEGNTFEGHTIIPFIESAQKRFGLAKPIIVADSGLLSQSNLEKLKELKYTFIIGARIKNESIQLKQKILSKTANIKDNQFFAIDKSEKLQLIVSYSDNRAKKDASNRQQGLARLHNKIKAGKLNKSNITNRGYNKFLNLESEIKVSIDESKIIEDQKWDGLKGYLTNSDLKPNLVIQTYNHLWKIEKAFRISKTDLRIRPIYHRKKDRIEAHICIAFAAYAVYKELEYQLALKKIDLSPQKTIELTKTIFEIHFRLPESQKLIATFNKLTLEQCILLEKLV